MMRCMTRETSAWNSNFSDDGGASAEAEVVSVAMRGAIGKRQRRDTAAHAGSEREPHTKAEPRRRTGERAVAGAAGTKADMAARGKALQAGR